MPAKKILHHIAGSFLENLQSAYNWYDNSVGFALALMRCRIFEAFQRGIERILSLLMFDLDNNAFRHKKESRDRHICISHHHPKIFRVWSYAGRENVEDRTWHWSNLEISRRLLEWCNLQFEYLQLHNAEPKRTRKRRFWNFLAWTRWCSASHPYQQMWDFYFFLLPIYCCMKWINETY